MTADGEVARVSSPYDQDDLGEDGYFSDAPLGLRRRQPRSRRDRVLTDQVRASKPLTKRQVVSRKRRGITIPLVVLLGSLAGLAWVAYERVAPADELGSRIVAAPPVVAAVEASTTGLFIQTDGSGATVSFTVAALRPDGRASLVFIPASTMVEIPGFGLDELSIAESLGGVDLARIAVENLLSLQFDHVVELTPAVLSELTRSFDPLLIENPSRIDVVNDQQRLEILYPRGAMLLSSADTANFLASRAVDESDLDRLVRHQEFWSRFLAERSTVVSEERDALAGPEGFFDELAVRVESSDYRILDVQILGGEAEIYGVDRDALPALVNFLDPSRSADVAPTLVQLLNGAGVPGLAPTIAEMLVEAGASVQLTDNANRFDHDVTQIVYYRDDQFEAAASIRAVLGVGDLVKAIDPIDVVDVTVVVGSDLAAQIVDLGAEVAPVSTGDVEIRRDSSQNDGPEE